MRPESKRYWDLAHPENNKERQRRWVERHPEEAKARVAKWRKEHTKLCSRYADKYIRNRILRDPIFKLRVSLRSRLGSAIRNFSKRGSAVRDLGCSIEEFKEYIESKFEEGMSWKNWGHRGWHLDHIKPLISFDLTDRDQLLIACNYRNLQPLWWNENLRKGRNK